MSQRPLGIGQTRRHRIGLVKCATIPVRTSSAPGWRRCPRLELSQRTIQFGHKSVAVPYVDHEQSVVKSSRPRNDHPDTTAGARRLRRLVAEVRAIRLIPTRKYRPAITRAIGLLGLQAACSLWPGLHRRFVYREVSSVRGAGCLLGRPSESQIRRCSGPTTGSGRAGYRILAMRKRAAFAPVVLPVAEQSRPGGTPIPTGPIQQRDLGDRRCRITRERSSTLTIPFAVRPLGADERFG
jgi:hypothetical protein